MTIKERLKYLICQHDWILGHVVEEYYDYSGHQVQIWRCYCRKCKRWKNKKFW